jgi:hypothetical protein
VKGKENPYFWKTIVFKNTKHMKRIIYTFLVLAISVAVGYSQTITGEVRDADTNEPLVGATVVFEGTTVGTFTDAMGKFTLEIPDGADKIFIQYIGYASGTFTLAEVRAGAISLGPDAYGLDEVVVTGRMDIVRDRRTPVAVSTVNNAELQAKGVGNVELVEAIKNTPSVYVSSQTGFGDSEMFLRGFNQINTGFLFNGQPINGMEDGRMYWSNWSGVSDISSAIQVQRGLGSSKLAISSVGGTVNFVTKTVDKDKGGFVRFMYGNDNYIKGTVAYNSGLTGKWAFSVLLDHWQADNKWAEGTEGQGQNYFLSVGFKPSDDHTLNFLVTGAPQWHGQRWSQSEEILKATPKFNQHWGEYNGDFETERRNYYHKPIINLSWDWDMNDDSQLSSVLYASFGRGGGTGNFGSSSNRVRTEDGQVDWDAIAANNAADADGIGTFSDNYALRASVNNHQWFGNVTNFSHKLSSTLDFNVGVDLRFYTGDHFRQLVDMFGLDGYNDAFGHATRPSDYVVTNTFDARPWAALSNFADEGDRIGYDYSEDINYQGLFAQIEHSKDQLSAFLQTSVSNQSYQRMGRWSDIGESEKVSKGGFNVKGGASYAVSLNSTVYVNAGYQSRQPFLDNIFEDIRGSNTLLTPEVDNEDIVGIEGGYKFQGQSFLLNLNVYHTTWGNRTRVDTYTNDNDTPDDEDDDFQQRDVERGIEQVHLGGEIEMQYLASDKIRFKAFASVGDWTFNAIESVTQFNDDTGAQIGMISGADNDGVHIPGAPQFSLGLGVNAEVVDGLTAYLDYNYADNIYLRGRDDILLEDIGTLDAYGVLDAGASYKFNVGNQRAVVRANVRNLLDNDAFNQSDAFGFYILNGTTWNTSVQLLF